jgi:hypothetical protein
MKIHIKQLVALSALLLFSSQFSSAQKSWSVGLRTGLELRNFTLNWNKDFVSGNLISNHEIFLAKKLGKHFELESSLRIGTLCSAGYYWAFDDYQTFDYDQTSTNLSLFLNVRYNFKIGEYFEIYPQLGTSFVKPFTNTSRTIYEPGKPAQYTSSKGNYAIVPFSTISPAIGVTYSPFNRLYANLTASVNYKLDGGYSVGWYTGMDPFPNDWSANILVGIGYRF